MLKSSEAIKDGRRTFHKKCAQVLLLMLLILVILLHLFIKIFAYRTYAEGDRVTLPPVVWQVTSSCWVTIDQFRFKLDGCNQVEEGEVVQITGTLEGMSDKTIFGQKSLTKTTFTILKPRPLSLLYWTAEIVQTAGKVRAWILKPIRQTVSFPEEALVESFVLGSIVALPEEIRQSVKVMGIAHVIAVSGSHLTLLGGMLQLVIRFRNRLIKTHIIILILVLYTTLVGWQPAVARALCMSVIVMLGKTVFHRQVSFARSLLVSAALMILVNPWVVFNIGWQLSVLATAGLCWVYPVLISCIKPSDRAQPTLSLEETTANWRHSLGLFFKKMLFLSCEATLASVAALVFIWPIMVGNFGTWSWGTLLSSLLLWWLFPLVISSCFIGVITVRVLSLFCMDPTILQICSSLLLEWPVRAITWLFEVIKGWDWLLVSSSDWPSILFVIWYCLAGGSLCWLELKKRCRDNLYSVLYSERLPKYSA